MVPYFLAKMCAEVPVSSLYPCLSAALMYKLCGLNAAEGKLERFIAILVVESIAASALGMSVGKFCVYMVRCILCAVYVYCVSVMYIVCLFVSMRG